MGYKDPNKQREFNRRWIAERKATWIKKNGPCVKCGSDKDLEVDHIDPATKTSHNVWSWTLERRNAELVKCQVLCYECHLNKTIEFRMQKRAHGTTTMYALKYRCTDCRNANTTYRRQYRLSRSLV
jgi:5-methylcytosine-specific restriction endonuclease McrA